MAQSQTQFTPAQIYDVARRAEAEGRHEHALQFYRHLVDHCAGTPEARAAHHAVIRLAPQPVTAHQPAGLNGSHEPAYDGPNGSAPEAHAAASSATWPTPTHAPVNAADPVRRGRQQPHFAAHPDAIERPAKPAETKQHTYLLGRIFAGIVIAVGAIAMASGCGLFAAVFIAPSFVGVAEGNTPLISAALSAVSVITIGIVLVLAGLTARAVFNNARVIQDLTAAEQYRHGPRR